MPTIPELLAFFGLIALAVVMIKLNRRYDLKKDEMNPVVKRKYK